MESINFCYWLQGYFEVLAAGDDPEAELTSEQVACIKDHLALVFDKHTPTRSGRDDRKEKAIKSKRITLPGELTVTCKADEKPVEWVTPPANANQIRLDIEAEVKKSLERTEPEKKRVGVEYWAGRSKPTFPSPTRWIGGGFGQRYC